jgi:hypothetical protein
VLKAGRANRTSAARVAPIAAATESGATERTPRMIRSVGTGPGSGARSFMMEPLCRGLVDHALTGQVGSVLALTFFNTEVAENPEIAEKKFNT